MDYKNDYCVSCTLMNYFGKTMRSSRIIKMVIPSILTSFIDGRTREFVVTSSRNSSPLPPHLPHPQTPRYRPIHPLRQPTWRLSHDLTVVKTQQIRFQKTAGLIKRNNGCAYHVYTYTYYTYEDIHLPSGYVKQFVIEHGHRNSGFTH